METSTRSGVPSISKLPRARTALIAVFSRVGLGGHPSQSASTPNPAVPGWDMQERRRYVADPNFFMQRSKRFPKLQRFRSADPFLYVYNCEARS